MTRSILSRTRSSRACTLALAAALASATGCGDGGSRADSQGGSEADSQGGSEADSQGGSGAGSQGGSEADNQGGSEATGRDAVVVAELERESLHFWRVRALSADAGGPWSEPSYFLVLAEAQSRAAPARPPVQPDEAGFRASGPAPATQRMAGDADPDQVALTKVDVEVTGVLESFNLPVPVWGPVEAATGYEVEIVAAESEQRVVSVLLPEAQACGPIGCTVRLVENRVTDNQYPRAEIDRREGDPARPGLLRFSGEGSRDPDGVIARYRWRIEGRYIGEAEGAAFEYRFDDSGSHRVGLAVTDDAGATALTYVDVDTALVDTSASPTSGGGDEVPNVPGAAGGESPEEPSRKPAPELGSAAPEPEPAPEPAPEPVPEPDGDFADPITVSAVRTWNVAGEVHRVMTVGDTLYVGGDFTEIYGPDGDRLPRTYLAAFDRFTGEPTDFAPGLDDNVRAFAVSPDERTLYVGGSFLEADGRSRKRVAAFDVRSGALTGFNPPTPNRALRAIAVTDERVYLGGLFTRIGGRDRPYVAAFDPATGTLDTGFVASPGDNVKALVAGPEGLWIGGDFSSVNGVGQRGLGLVDLVDGSLEPSDDVTAEVIDLAASDDQLFVAVGGPGGRAAAFDRATGEEQWTISSDGNFQAVDVDEGRYVYFGGHYEIVEGNTDADRMTRHDKRTGRMDVSWLPRVNGIRSINVLDVRADGLYAGGDFTKVDLEPREGFAILAGRTD